MKITNVVTIICTLIALSSVAYGRSFDNKFDRMLDRQESNKLRSTGTIQCEVELKSNQEDCQLSFIRLSDSEEFEIVDSPKLVELHMMNHKPLDVTLAGVLTMSAIFHPSHLRVESFVVNGEGRAKIKERRNPKNNKTIRIHERFNQFDR